MSRNALDVRLTSLIVARFHLEQLLAEPPSATGGQLEVLRRGVVSRGGGRPNVHVHDDGALWRRTLMADRVQAGFADAIRLFRALTPEQVTALRIRYWWTEQGDYNCSTGRGSNHEVYERTTGRIALNSDDVLVRVVTSTDMKGRPLADALVSSRVLRTRDGEDYVREAEGQEEAPEDARQVVVRGVRRRLTSFGTIARVMLCTVVHARQLVDEGRARLAEAMREREGRGNAGEESEAT